MSRQSRTVQQWFDEYGVSHQNKTNKRIHWIMVPVIFFTIVGLLWSIPKADWMGASPLRKLGHISHVASNVFLLHLIGTYLTWHAVIYWIMPGCVLYADFILSHTVMDF